MEDHFYPPGGGDFDFRGGYHMDSDFGSPLESPKSSSKEPWYVGPAFSAFILNAFASLAVGAYKGYADASFYPPSLYLPPEGLEGFIAYGAAASGLSGLLAKLSHWDAFNGVISAGIFFSFGYGLGYLGSHFAKLP